MNSELEHCLFAIFGLSIVYGAIVSGTVTTLFEDVNTHSSTVVAITNWVQFVWLIVLICPTIAYCCVVADREAGRSNQNYEIRRYKHVFWARASEIGFYVFWLWAVGSEVIIGIMSYDAGFWTPAFEVSLVFVWVSLVVTLGCVIHYVPNIRHAIDAIYKL